MARRRCCCGNCRVYEDDFDRPESTDLGEYWDEEVGSWWISHDNTPEMELKELGTAGSIVIFNRPMTGEYMKVGIQIREAVVGGIYRLYLNWLDDENHLYAEFERTDATDFSLSIHKVVGGSDSTLDTTIGELAYPTIDDRWFTACIDPESFTAAIEDDALCWCYADDIDPIEDGVYGGIGHGNSAATYFDDWFINDTYIGKITSFSPRGYCDACGECLCDDYMVPWVLTGTYDGLSDCNGSPIEGITFTLYRQKCGSDAVYLGTISGSCLDGLKIELWCGSNGGGADDWEGWTLVVNPDGDMSYACLHAIGVEEEFEPESGDCDPFQLVFRFGPDTDEYRRCPTACAPCGQDGPAEPPPEITMEYTITITE